LGPSPAFGFLCQNKSKGLRAPGALTSHVNFQQRQLQNPPVARDSPFAFRRERWPSTAGRTVVWHLTLRPLPNPWIITQPKPSVGP